METLREWVLIVAAICVFGGMLSTVAYVAILIVRGGLGGEKPAREQQRTGESGARVVGRPMRAAPRQVVEADSPG